MKACLNISKHIFQLQRVKQYSCHGFIFVDIGYQGSDVAVFTNSNWSRMMANGSLNLPNERKLPYLNMKFDNDKFLDGDRIQQTIPTSCFRSGWCRPTWQPDNEAICAEGPHRWQKHFQLSFIKSKKDEWEFIWNIIQHLSHEDTPFSRHYMFTDHGLLYFT